MREGVSSAAICVVNEEIYLIGGGPSVKIATEKVQVNRIQTRIGVTIN